MRRWIPLAVVTLVIGGCSTEPQPPFAWISTQHLASTTLRDISAYRNGYVIAVGDHGVVFVSSTDGASWERAVSDATEDTDLLAVAADSFGASPALAGGAHGFMMRSSDFGLFWRRINFPSTDDIVAIDVKPGAQLALTRGGVMFVSRDSGDHWSAEIAADAPLVAADYCSNKLVVLDERDTLHVLDDYGWQDKALPTTVRVHAVRCVGLYDRLVVAGDDGVLLSADTPSASFAALPRVTDKAWTAISEDWPIAVGSAGQAVFIDVTGEERIPEVTTDDLLSACTDESRAPVKVFAVGSAGVLLTGEFRH